MREKRYRPTERTCRHCSREFVGNYNSSSCPECRDAIKLRAFDDFRRNNPGYWRKWQKNNGHRVRASRLLSEYGITQSDWDVLHAAQNGSCAICGATGGWRANAGRLVVDHCHNTNQVRGLLCPSCNRGLGQFEDDPERLRQAARYIEESVGNPCNS